MKSNSERFHAGFHRFLAGTGHEEPSEAEMDALLQEYVKIFNERARTLEPLPEEARRMHFWIVRRRRGVRGSV